MSPVTRSRELLNVMDGLFFIEGDVIDMVSDFYAELRSTAATFGDDSVEKLLPHVTSLLNRLNDMTKNNNDLKKEVELLQDNLSASEERCFGLNISYKDKSVACCVLEEQYDADLSNLTTQLAKLREENENLKNRLEDNANIEVNRLYLESLEKIEVLTAERKQLMTTVEVMEADIKCLRAELRRAETKWRQRRSSGDDLMAELAAAEATSYCPPSPHRPCTANAASQTSTSAMDVTPPDLPLPPTPPADGFKSVLLIGDSHVRYSSRQCVNKGCFLECCPGGKILDIKNRILSFIGVSLSVIYIHVGCNNLQKGYRGGPGYNGGHGKREVLHSMADLLYTVRVNFPGARVFLNSVLVRRDISYKALYDFNYQLDLMCNNFGVEFVEANSCVRRRDLGRDGVHFNRGAVSRLGALFVGAISAALQSVSADSNNQNFSLCPEPEGVVLDAHCPRVSLDGPSVSGN